MNIKLIWIDNEEINATNNEQNMVSIKMHKVQKHNFDNSAGF